MSTEKKTKLKNAVGLLYAVCAFGILDVWLRVVTRWIGAYSIYELAPNLFTLLWAVLLAALVTVIPSRRAGRIVYGVIYYVCMVYAVVQYGAYLILGRFLYLSDFLYAGEGADYASWVISLLTPAFLAQVLGLTAVGAVGIVLFPERRNGKWAVAARVGTAALCLVGMTLVPGLYGSTDAEDQWDDFLNPAFEYQQFTNANFDMELTGMYQYFARDIQVQLARGENREEAAALVDEFFADRTAHTENEMTGLLAGKNLIVVMMETMDDWLITQEDTPTLYRMMSEGINFSNLYAPQYSNGYTFNTEFAFNTSVYPYSNGNVAYSLLGNDFSNSIANRFALGGYAVNSYHVGLANFYNRGLMHEAWGYERYHSYQDYGYDGLSPHDDRYLVECDELYGDLVQEEPFFSFVISYSGHLPYTNDDELTQTALALYPQYDVAEDREVNILRAKVRLTDDMFTGLLERLEADGLLEDTVIVCYGDHYAYGITDEEKLLALSEDAGSSILEKTPAFIYCAGMELSMEVDKVMQITDLAPTILNLFGLEVPKRIMGQDIFDEGYAGYVIFSGSSWLTETTYMKNGVIQWNNGMTQDQIAQMNAYVQQVHQVNDAILDADYYR